MVSRRVKPFFDSVIDGPDGTVTPVDWPDAHRVMMLRMYCGIVSSEVARWRQLQAAGERAHRDNLKSLRITTELPGVIEDLFDSAIPSLLEQIREHVSASVELLRNAYSDTSIPVSKSILLIMATQKYLSFAEKDLIDFHMHAHITDELRRVVPIALRQYDLFYSAQADDTTKIALRNFDLSIDKLLSMIGLEAFSPENGAVFDPDSGAIKTEITDPILPNNIIKKCLARGYRWRSTGHVELHPYLQVNRKKTPDA
jgi:hypothetical protein